MTFLDKSSGYSRRMVDTPDAPGFTTEQLETWSALATLLEWLPPALDAQLQRDAGLTHFEYGILFALNQADDRTLRMSVLADYANSTLTRLSRAATRLENKGLLRRSPDPTDGRYTLATLTDAGAAKAAQATPGHAANVQRLVFDALTPTQSKQLLTISRKITAAVRESPGWRPAAPDSRHV